MTFLTLEAFPTSCRRKCSNRAFNLSYHSFIWTHIPSIANFASNCSTWVLDLRIIRNECSCHIVVSAFGAPLWLISRLYCAIIKSISWSFKFAEGSCRASSAIWGLFQSFFIWVGSFLTRAVLEVLSSGHAIVTSRAKIGLVRTRRAVIACWALQALGSIS